METTAKQLASQVIPLPGGGGEKLFGLRAPLREHRLQSPLVLLSAIGAGDLLADQRPQLLRAGIELLHRHPIKAARAITPRHHPAVVSQRLDRKSVVEGKRAAGSGA